MAGSSGGAINEAGGGAVTIGGSAATVGIASNISGGDGGRYQRHHRLRDRPRKLGHAGRNTALNNGGAINTGGSVPVQIGDAGATVSITGIISDSMAVQSTTPPAP